LELAASFKARGALSGDSIVVAIEDDLACCGLGNLGLLSASPTSEEKSIKDSGVAGIGDNPMLAAEYDLALGPNRGGR
jgi:hypothetical protein